MANDPFSSAHRAKERADKLKAAKDEIDQRKQATAQKMLDRMKQPFNDVPQYKFRDVFKLSGPR